jgi:hypothetical protein
MSKCVGREHTRTRFAEKMAEHASSTEGCHMHRPDLLVNTDSWFSMSGLR